MYMDNYDWLFTLAVVWVLCLKDQFSSLERAEYFAYVLLKMVNSWLENGWMFDC